MRPFEAATVLLLVVAWGSYVVPLHKRPRWLFVLPALAVVAAIVQLSVEHYRWQMVPAYALVAFFDKHLLGIASPLLDGPDPNYPEVDFQSR